MSAADDKQASPEQRPNHKQAISYQAIYQVVFGTNGDSFFVLLS